MHPLKYILLLILANFWGSAFATEAVIYSESFATSLGEFTAENSTVWTFNSTYSCAYATGFIRNVKNEYENARLISPTIDLTGITTDVSLDFDHTGKFFGTLSEQVKLQVTTDDGVSWTDITIPTYFSNSNYTIVNSGDISLNAYRGKKVRVAFCYSSNTTNAGNWEVKNFEVKTILKTPTCNWNLTAYTQVNDNIFPFFFSTSDGDVTYSSSDISVATIDAAGNVTLKAAGKTTITANYAATSNYSANSINYILTVIESDGTPTIGSVTVLIDKAQDTPSGNATLLPAITAQADKVLKR